MKIKKFILNWLNSGDNNVEILKDPGITQERESLDDHRCLNFKVWFAQGGQVIQTRRYDHHKDKLFTSLYVIHDNESLGDKLNEIIIKESLYQ